MKIGFVGLGRMGKNIVLNLLEKGIKVCVYNRSPGPVEELAARGAVPAASYHDLVSHLSSPRIIWVMVAAGKPVDQVIFDGLAPHLKMNDLIIEGGNSYFKNSLERYHNLKSRGVGFLDVGSSGGLSGARHGASFTIGGEEAHFKRAEAIFKAAAAPNGYAYVGPAGAGHFVKMVHNGLEYAMLQAIGEGFELLESGPYADLDFAQIAKVWNHGGVIRSWLMELAQEAFSKDPRLARFAGEVGGGETGFWAIKTAWEQGVPFSLIAQAYSLRLLTRRPESYAGKVIAALRNEFGGHPFKENKKKEETHDRN